jgi:acyl-CoA synthetase (AMP-forming)/AMP-acid ligase II
MTVSIGCASTDADAGYRPFADELDMADTIPALLRETTSRCGGKAALVPANAAPMTFAQLHVLTDLFAKALIRDGMAVGERAAIWAPNVCEWVAAAIGIQRAGGVMIPLYFRYRGTEVAEILDRARASRLICTADLAGELRAHDCASLRRVIVLGDGDTRGCEASWGEFIEQAKEVSDESLHARERGVTGESISDIMFTSGTTGRPKGAVFTHRSSVAAGRIMQHYNGATEADCFCPMGTFAHVGGYKQGWLTGLTSGASIAWGDAFDPPSVLELVSRLGITIMPAPPITWQGLLDYPARGEWDISKLRFAATGGTMIPPELVRRLISETEIAQVGTGYGMTETCGMDAYTRPGDPLEKLTTTVGQPAPDTDIRIVDAEGRELGTGETGEVLIRNPRLLIEYLDDPAATGAAIVDGWFRSGDLGSLDADGYLRITDRLKDMYIINGLNVYPAEVERLLETLDGVSQCAVIGVPEPVKGEVGAAFIVRAADAQLSAAAVTDWCKGNLAGYKVPKYVTFVDQLHRNVMGKVLKNELRTKFSG